MSEPKIMYQLFETVDEIEMPCSLKPHLFTDCGNLLKYQQMLRAVGRQVTVKEVLLTRAAATTAIVYGATAEHIQHITGWSADDMGVIRKAAELTQKIIDN